MLVLICTVLFPGNFEEKKNLPYSLPMTTDKTDDEKNKKTLKHSLRDRQRAMTVGINLSTLQSRTTLRES